MEEVDTTPGNYANLLALENQSEHTVTLTLGQIKVIQDLLEQHLEAKGYHMISLVHDLFNRLHSTTDGQKEAFE